MEPVAAQQPASLDPGGHDRVRRLFVRVDLPDDALDTEHPRAGLKCCVQRRPAHATTGAVPKTVIDPAGSVKVTDAREGAPRWVDAEPCERRDGTRHEPLATGLVDRRRPRFDDGDREPGHPRLDRGGEADRSSAGDEQVDHRCGPLATSDAVGRSVERARFSTGIRKASSSTALSTVTTIAVIHAVCTSGKANPSTTTAT